MPTDKTKIIHFRNPAQQQSAFQFHCGDAVIALVDRYRYLGLVFTEFLDYGIMAKEVSLSAGRALGLLIAKAKSNGGFPFGCFSKLYDSLVQPIIDYGASVWGQTEHGCINAIHNRACRFFMGVGRYTPNLAVQADMGWTSPWQRRWVSVTRQWGRLCNMSDDRLNKKVFVWANARAESNCKNWVFRSKKCFNDLNMTWLCDLNRDFNMRQVFAELNTVLWEHNQSRWLEGVTRPGAIRGAGRNKLRTYCTFKREWETEEYMRSVTTRSHRSALAKFRCGVAPLRLETGRYERGRIPVEERICLLCDCNEVESEAHVILKCPLYQDLRVELFATAEDVNVLFNELLDNEKVSFLLSNTNIVKKTARVLHSILQRRQCVFHQQHVP